jgi:circadian clock protein KaiB
MASSPDSEGECYALRLYVSGNTPRSTRAIRNLKAMCDLHLAGAYTLEVIDIYQNPKAARDAQIIAVPTLMKLNPLPVRLLIGDLSDSATLRSALGID